MGHRAVGGGQGGADLKRGRLAAHGIATGRELREQLLTFTYPSLKSGSCPPRGQIPPRAATQRSCPGCWQLVGRTGFEVSLAGFALAPAWPPLLLKTFFFNQPRSKFKKLAVQELGLLADSLGSICLHRL